MRLEAIGINVPRSEHAMAWVTFFHAILVCTLMAVVMMPGCRAPQRNFDMPA